jgi:hypothetical protein
MKNKLASNARVCDRALTAPLVLVWIKERACLLSLICLSI